MWDDFSPSHFGIKPNGGAIGGRPLDTGHWNPETFCLAGAGRYASDGRNRIDKPDSAHSKWSAYASIDFSGADADGRQRDSYVRRVSGKVEGVRLPKEMYYVSRVMPSERPDLHLRSTATAMRAGLTPATLKLESQPVAIVSGLVRATPP